MKLFEYEFGDKKSRKTKEQIAEELGITRMTLYRWETQDDNFIAYRNQLAQTYLSSRQSEVFEVLMRSIRNGSMRGVELFFKAQGLLKDQSEITITDGGETIEERTKRLAERLKAIEEEAQKED